MGFVTYELGTAALVDALTVLVAAASALLLIRFRINFAWLVLAGAVIGLLRFVV
jgi:chromate transporter